MSFELACRSPDRHSSNERPAIRTQTKLRCSHRHMRGRRSGNRALMLTTTLHPLSRQLSSTPKAKKIIAQHNKLLTTCVLPVGSRRQDDSSMDARDYTKYVMRRHNLNDNQGQVPSSPLSSALLKRKSQFQGQPDLGDPVLSVPGTPPGVDAYTQYVMQRHGLRDDPAAPSSPLSSALLKKKVAFQNDTMPGTPPGGTVCRLDCICNLCDCR